MSRSRRVTSMSPGDFTATADPKLDLQFTSVYIHHFLTLPQPCFPTSSTDLGFSCWQTLENQWISCHVFKGKIHSDNNYAKYSGIVTTREMLALIIPKGQQPSNNQQVQKPTAGRLPQATPSSLLPSHPGVLLSGGT